MSKINRPEEELHRLVVAYLWRALPGSAVFHHSPNGGKRSKAEGGIFKALGTRAGWPDLEIIWEGRAYFIELKAPRGRPPTPAQKACHDDLTYAGAKVAVCTSLEGVEANLKAWGFNLSARPT